MVALEPEHVALSLPFATTSAAIARNQIRTWLAEHQVAVNLDDDFVEDSRLVVSELVGNAVRHAEPLADGTMVVAWCSCEEGLDISVTDGGAPTRPTLVRAGASSLGGRGLGIVSQLSKRWWLESSRGGSTVHAMLAN